MRLTTPGYLANFDSATAMLRATASYLHGKDFPGLGITSSALQPAAVAINHLPRRLREQIYIWSGWGEAISPRRLSSVRSEEVAGWMTGLYPNRRYPAVAIGSSGGAMVHLCSALGIPWLPQTFLIPVRRSLHPDEPKQDIQWAIEPARKLLESNPQLQLHHMHDPNQDRLMIRRMTYFRVKRRELGEAYEQFLKRTLSPGGTILLVECGLTWPTVRIAERHLFQFGAYGGIEPEEYYNGGPRVRDYLRRYGSHRRQWDAPDPDGETPEAEWGFEPALRDDVIRFARQHGYRVQRLVFERPEDLSPLVADLHRWQYGQRNMPARRLLVESFIVMEPWWTLRTGSVPFWLSFATEPAADQLEQYLDEAGPFDEIHLMLFSHGVDSAGLATIDRWRGILRRASVRGRFLGVDEREFPRDFASFIRYHTDAKRLPARYPMPGPMTLEQFASFATHNRAKYRVRWIEHTADEAAQRTTTARLPAPVGVAGD